MFWTRTKLYIYLVGIFTVIIGILIFAFTPQWLISAQDSPFILLLLFILPLLLVYSVFMIYVIRKKYRESIMLAIELARGDAMWNLQAISNRIESIFYALQQSLCERDLSTIQPYVSDNFLSKLNCRIQQEHTSQSFSIREDIALRKQTLVSIADFQENSKDCLWVIVSFSMKKYVIDKNTGQALEVVPIWPQRYKV